MSSKLDQPAPYNGQGTPQPLDVFAYGQFALQQIFKRSMLEEPTITSRAPWRPIHTSDLNWKERK